MIRVLLFFVFCSLSVPAFVCPLSATENPSPEVLVQQLESFLETGEREVHKNVGEEADRLSNVSLWAKERFKGLSIWSAVYFSMIGLVNLMFILADEKLGAIIGFDLLFGLLPGWRVLNDLREYFKVNKRTKKSFKDWQEALRKKGYYVPGTIRALGPWIQSFGEEESIEWTEERRVLLLNEVKDLISKLKLELQKSLITKSFLDAVANVFIARGFYGPVESAILNDTVNAPFHDDTVYINLLRELRFLRSKIRNQLSISEQQRSELLAPTNHWETPIYGSASPQLIHVDPWHFLRELLRMRDLLEADSENPSDALQRSKDRMKDEIDILIKSIRFQQKENPNADEWSEYVKELRSIKYQIDTIQGLTEAEKKLLLKSEPPMLRETEKFALIDRLEKFYDNDQQTLENRVQGHGLLKRALLNRFENLEFLRSLSMHDLTLNIVVHPAVMVMAPTANKKGMAKILVEFQIKKDGQIVFSVFRNYVFDSMESTADQMTGLEREFSTHLGSLLSSLKDEAAKMGVSLDLGCGPALREIFSSSAAPKNRSSMFPRQKVVE